MEKIKEIRMETIKSNKRETKLENFKKDEFKEEISSKKSEKEEVLAN
ncbi:MAG: hypothetical protein Q4A00_07565 [Flavobacteriaceae bacterium]|nr:hypothetical protein [Flavobacteriaceae bacterium]